MNRVESAVRDSVLPGSACIRNHCPLGTRRLRRIERLNKLRSSVTGIEAIAHYHVGLLLARRPHPATVCMPYGRLAIRLDFIAVRQIYRTWVARRVHAWRGLRIGYGSIVIRGSGAGISRSQINDG